MKKHHRTALQCMPTGTLSDPSRACPQHRKADLFDGVLLPGHFSHLGDDGDVVLKLHLQTLGKGEVGFGANWEAQLL